MARIAFFGAETKSALSEGCTLSSSITFETTAAKVRSGIASFKCTSGAADTQSAVQVAFSGSAGIWYRARVYIFFDDLPDSGKTARVMQGGAPNEVSIRLTSAGKIQLWTGSQVGSDSSATITTGQWYRLELGLKYGAGAVDAVDAYLDGVQVASGSSLTVADVPPTAVLAGWCAAGNEGNNKVCYIDDFALNDDQGANQNGFPGSEKVVLLVPISDNARDALWTGGVGGTSSLFEAVNNTPPIGTATETDLSQIEHAGGAAGTTDRYDANMTTYTTAGIALGDTINVIQFFDVDGEDITTGTKLLNLEVLSNPVMASPGNVTAGDDAGLLGTYPSLWSAHRSGMTYAPSVTLTTSPVMRVRRPETASRVASVCFMGIYVAYTPMGTRTAQTNQAVKRASTF